MNSKTVNSATVKIISQGICGYLVYLQFTWSQRYQISCYLLLYRGPDSYATILQTLIHTDCSIDSYATILQTPIHTNCSSDSYATILQTPIHTDCSIDSYATILQTPVHTDCSIGLKRPKDKLASTSIRVRRPATLDLLDTSYTVVSLVFV